MLDNIYENIGGKIKVLAKWAFIVEALGAIITGIVLLFTDRTLALYGLITIFFGPIVAFVSTWLLYALGELVEKTCANECNTRNILIELQKKQSEKNDNVQNKKNLPEIYNYVTTEIDGFCIEGEILKKYNGNKSEIIITKNIKVVGEQAFSKNNNVVSITIPENITTISEWAFYNCKNLETINISNSVTHIGKNSFYGCEKLKICASIGSFAYQYAKDNNISFDEK